MKYTNKIMTIIILLSFFIPACSSGEKAEPAKEEVPSIEQSAADKSVQKPRSACDFFTKEDVEKITGIAVINVVLQDRDVFTSCSYETDNWENTTGVIFYPGLKTPASSPSLAEELRRDIERDQAPYKTPEPVEGIADVAAYYTDNDELMHFMVLHQGSDGRIIISANTREAVTELAKMAAKAK